MVLGLVRIPAKPKIKSCAGSKRGHGSWTGSSHRSRSPLCHSWSRSRLAHSSRRAHSSWSRSPHSWSRSPHSWSRSPRSSQSSPWFWWVESGVGQRSRWRERRCSGVQSPGPGASIYLCQGQVWCWAHAHFLVTGFDFSSPVFPFAAAFLLAQEEASACFVPSLSSSPFLGPCT